MSDLARAIAFAYRRKGVDAMPGGDLRLLLAYDLRWFAPEDAKRVVQRAIEVGLLRDESGALRPAFDARGIDIPLNFRPSLDVLDEAAPPVAPPAAPAPPPARAPPASDVEKAAEDERRRRGLRLGIDVARLVVRRRAGDDVKADAAALEARLLRGA
ncbi:MAG TPA: DUF2240 family protein [Candidatus Thermoplasmatota archaeon]|nr:DUF2240 family protein [Candidatus Thermoplasmatota archaeon]